MEGCHAVEITSFGGIDGKFLLSVPKQPELKNHQINMAKSSMQSAKIIATAQRNATHDGSRILVQRTLFRGE